MHGRDSYTQGIATELAGIRAGGATCIAFPIAKKALSGMDASGIDCAIRPLTVAGAAQVRQSATRLTTLLPVELRRVSHTASTNLQILPQIACTKPYNISPMSNQNPIDQITERVDRLLARHAELARANALLLAQVASLTQERDSLKSRLSAARARVDALIDRLPDTSSVPEAAP